MKKRIRAIHRLVRPAVVTLAVLFILGGPVPVWMARFFPALAPLSFLAGVLSQRGWQAGLFWIIPPVFFLAIACFRGRFFCRWVCPLGASYQMLSPGRTRKRLLKHRLNGYIFWFITGASVTGLPVALFLDPQPTMQRYMLGTGGMIDLAALIPGLLFPLFLLLGLLQPLIWCSHLCPTGYLLETLHGLTCAPRRTIDRERRHFLAGLLAGMPLAALAAWWPHSKRPHTQPPLLPPGARPPPDFGGTCNRCYTCVGVCPTGILFAGFRADRPMVEWFQPEMDPNRGGCEKNCVRCGQACPTGAIRPLTPDEKPRIRIGLAEVRHSLCVAWEHGRECMLCARACPYGAIVPARSSRGTSAPRVLTGNCTGCGYCQHVCPTPTQAKAVIVRA